MKTLSELYNEVIANEELKKAFAEAAKADQLVEFAKEHGCETTLEDMKAFRDGDKPLSLDELDSAAGGGSCKEYWVECGNCGKKNKYKEGEPRPKNCQYCSWIFNQ